MSNTDVELFVSDLNIGAIPQDLFSKIISIRKGPAFSYTNQMVIEFANGFAASIVRGIGTYGADRGLFELAVLEAGSLHYENPVAREDVRGELTPIEVLELLREISEFNDETIEAYAKEKRQRVFDDKYQAVYDKVVALVGGLDTATAAGLNALRALNEFYEDKRKTI